MTDWFIGLSFVAMFIAAIIEVALNYGKERKDDAQSRIQKVDVENQAGQRDTEAQVQKQLEKHSETVTAT